jgi:hypothetical protein
MRRIDKNRADEPFICDQLIDIGGETLKHFQTTLPQYLWDAGGRTKRSWHVEHSQIIASYVEEVIS